MLKLVGAAALKDSIGMLKSDELFFSKVKADRESAVRVALPDFPKSLVCYLSEVSEEQFLTETREAVQVFEGFERAEQSGLLSALAKYISEDLGAILDQLDSEFFFKKLSEREAELERLVPGDSALSLMVREMLLESTYQEVTYMASDALSTISEVPVVVIQTPRELNASDRAKIRMHFNREYPGSFAEFQNNPQIIGGMRVFVKGYVADHSWLGKIQAITSISV